MSHTSTIKARIHKVVPAILAQTMDIIRKSNSGVVVKEEASGYLGRGGVFDYAIQPEGRHAFLGLGCRVDQSGGLEFGTDSTDLMVLGQEWHDQQQASVVKTYTSLVVVREAELLGYSVDVLSEGVHGESNRLALRVAA